MAACKSFCLDVTNPDGEGGQVWKTSGTATCDSLAIAKWCRSLAQIGLREDKEEAAVPEPAVISDGGEDDCSETTEPKISDVPPLDLPSLLSRLGLLIEGALAPVSLAVERFSVKLDGESAKIVARIEDLSARLSAMEEGWAWRPDTSSPSLPPQPDPSSCNPGSLDEEVAAIFRRLDEAQEEVGLLHQKLVGMEAGSAADHLEVVARLDRLRESHEDRGLRQELAAQITSDEMSRLRARMDEMQEPAGLRQELAAQITNDEMSRLRARMDEMQEHLSAEAISKQVLHRCQSDVNDISAELRQQDVAVKGLELAMQEIKSERCRRDSISGHEAADVKEVAAAPPEGGESGDFAARDAEPPPESAHPDSSNLAASAGDEAQVSKALSEPGHDSSLTGSSGGVHEPVRPDSVSAAISPREPLEAPDPKSASSAASPVDVVDTAWSAREAMLPPLPACSSRAASRSDSGPEQHERHSESLDYSVPSESRLQADCDIVEEVRLAAVTADEGEKCPSPSGADADAAFTADSVFKDPMNDFDDSFEFDADDNSSGDVVLVGQMLSSSSILQHAEELNSSKEASESPTDAWSAKPLQLGGAIMSDYEEDFESP